MGLRQSRRRFTTGQVREHSPHSCQKSMGLLSAKFGLPGVRRTGPEAIDFTRSSTLLVETPST